MTTNPPNGYKAFFGRRPPVDITARTAYEAQQKAVAHYKPRKSQAHMVSVCLCERPLGVPVVHAADF